MGSGVKGEKVTFSILPKENYLLKSVYLNGDIYTLDNEEEDYRIKYNYGIGYFAGYYIETTMPENGFVVSANFKEITEGHKVVDLTKGESYIDLDTALKDSGKEERYITLVDADVAYDEKVAISNKSTIIDLNGKNIKATQPFELRTGVEKFIVCGHGQIYNKESISVSDAFNTFIDIHTAALPGETETEVKVPMVYISSNVEIDSSLTGTESLEATGIRVSNIAIDKDGDSTQGVSVNLYAEGAITMSGNYSTGILVNGDQAEETGDLTSYSADLSSFGTDYNKYSKIIINVGDSSDGSGSKVVSGKHRGIEIHAGTLNVTGGADVQSDGTAILATKEYDGDKVTVNVKTGSSVKTTDDGDTLDIYCGYGVIANIGSDGSFKSNKQKYVLYKDKNGEVYVETMNPKDTVTYKIISNSEFDLKNITIDKTKYITGFGESSGDSESGFTYSVTMDKVQNWKNVGAEFYEIPTTSAATSGNVSIGEMGYETLDDAISSITRSSTEKTTIKLQNSIEISKVIYLQYYAGEIEIDLNGKDITFKSDSQILIGNAKVSIVGAGNINGENYIFQVIGGYNQNWLNEKGYSYPETSLSIGEDVKTSNTKNHAIGVYKTNLGPKVPETDLTNKLSVTYKGSDTSSKGIINVDGDIKGDHENCPVINIEKASSTGNSYVAGYSKLTVKNSTFTTSGTAFNIKAGEINFEENTFTNNKKKVKTPYFVDRYSYRNDGNATVWLQDGCTGYDSITKAVFKNNKFENEDSDTDYYNIALFTNDSNGRSVVTPEFYDQADNSINADGFTYSKYYMAKKASELYSADFYGNMVYFLTEDDQAHYSKQQYLEDYPF